MFIQVAAVLEPRAPLRKCAALVSAFVREKRVIRVRKTTAIRFKLPEKVHVEPPLFRRLGLTSEVKSTAPLSAESVVSRIVQSSDQRDAQRPRHQTAHRHERGRREAPRE